MSEIQNIDAIKKAKSLFEEAMEIPKTDRLSFIEERCQGDEDLLENCKRLLDNTLSNNSFMEMFYGSSESDQFSDHHVGLQFGAYKIQSKLGSGGMADVYLATRVDGVYDNTVALKVIRGWGNTQKLINRFHIERSILANLKHPNIAQLLDGGSTDTGLPYFVLEYIEGERIDAFCRLKELSVKQRLKLFLKVCSALDFAHRNLVIHRDIKPSNIIVARSGEPKLLDFGLAKLLDPEKSNDLTATEMAMTPNYASPEQLRGKPLTTASDIYSIGILLYELLTGKRPYELMTKSTSLFDRTISDFTILAPSQKVLQCTNEDKINPSQTINDLAYKRKLSKTLKGDLDTIVLKLLRSEPERRYQSIKALMEDIERYLSNRPVLAHKDAFWYRSGKFIRRNKAVLSVSIAALVVLLSSAMFQQYRIISERDIAIQERNKFQHTQEFLISLFKISSPDESKGNTITARELLNQGAIKIEQDLSQQPQVKSELLITMGRVYSELGLYKDASPLLSKALELRQQYSAGNSVEITNSKVEIALLNIETGKYQEAEVTLTEALDVYQTTTQDVALQKAKVLRSLGALKYFTGKYQDALDYFNQALRISIDTYGHTHTSVARLYNNIGATYWLKGEYDNAIAAHNKSLSIKIKLVDSDHPSISRSYNNLANVYDEIGDYEKAIEYLNKSLEIDLKTLGPDHPGTSDTYNNLAVSYGKQGDYIRAINYLKKVLDIQIKVFEPDHPYMADTYNNLGNANKFLKNYEVALDYARQALAIKIQAYGENHPSTASTLTLYGSVYEDQKRFEQALPFYEKALKIYLETLDSNHASIADALINVAICINESGNHEKALNYNQRALEIYLSHFDDNHASVAHAYFGMGLAYSKLKNFDLAVKNYQKALDIRVKALGREHVKTLEAETELAKTLTFI